MYTIMYKSMVYGNETS